MPLESVERNATTSCANTKPVDPIIRSGIIKSMKQVTLGDIVKSDPGGNENKAYEPDEEERTVDSSSKFCEESASSLGSLTDKQEQDEKIPDYVDSSNINKPFKCSFSFSFNDDVPIEEKGEPAVEFYNNTNGSPKSPVALQPCIKKGYSRQEIPICIRNKSWKQLPIPDLNHNEKHYARSFSAPVNCLEGSGNRIKCNLQSLSSDIIDSEPRKVKFDTVHIRSYNQTIGDNPSVSVGTPISLDWAYEQLQPHDIELYEESRSPMRRSQRNLTLNYYQREYILSKIYGHDMKDIKLAKRNAKKTKLCREITLSLLPAQKVEEAIESFGRKTKRYLRKKIANNNKL